MFSFIWKTIKLILVLSLLGVILLYALFQYYSSDLPSYMQLVNYNPPSVTRIYSADGKLMGEYAKENRVFVPIDNIPTSLIQAFIAAEDKNFYQHPGIDIYALVRAASKVVINVAQNKRVEGASTITQQVVKTFLLGPERSLSRKIKEAILSYRISQVYTKDKILELYLNEVFLGQGSYGVASAAKRYFNKSLEELDLAESAFLAALPKFPSILNSVKNYPKAKNRRNYVIQRMLDDQYIGQDAAKQAIELDIVLHKPEKDSYLKTGSYCEKVRAIVSAMIGQDVFYSGGLTIITTLDSKIQKATQSAFIKGIRSYDRSYGFKGPIARLSSFNNWSQELQQYDKEPRLLEYQAALVLDVLKDKIEIGFSNKQKATIHLNQMKWARGHLKTPAEILKKLDVIAVSKTNEGYALVQIPKVDGATLVMEPRSGKVLAMVSGYDFKSSQFDRANQALRQPGSLIKPFVYLTALEQNIEPNTIFEDKPIEIDQGYGMPFYKPKNFGDNYLGPLTMRSGLELSRNTITVQIAHAVGLANVAETIKRFGINQDPAHFYSMALGALETKLDKITSAYASIANRCQKVVPEFIEMVKDRNGNIIYRRDKRVCSGCSIDSNQDLNSSKLPKMIDKAPITTLTDEASCYQITSMLQGVVLRGTAKSAAKFGKVFAAKTGTSNNSKDTWFVGFNPKIVVGIYVGFDDPKTLGQRATGSTVALPIFNNMMEQEPFKSMPSLPLIAPESIAEIHVNPYTGVQVNKDEQPNIVENLKKMLLQNKDLPTIDDGRQNDDDNKLFDGRQNNLNDDNNKIIDDGQSNINNQGKIVDELKELDQLGIY
jgi:penicillin-binding protein 1A